MTVTEFDSSRRFPTPSAMLELIKPITWFPPMWAFLCGAISSGVSPSGRWFEIALGVALAGPIVCGMSQAANDWCDRHVDAINEPNRPIPSGRIPGSWGFWIAVAMTALSLFVGSFLGVWGFVATIVGVICAWAYSVEPIRLKRSGWWGPGLVGLCYEGLPWFTGAAVLAADLPITEIIIIAMLYALGAHGIMTLNDFKALEGDRETGVNSLPVTLGPERAAQVACIGMAIPQVIIICLLGLWGMPVYGLAVFALLIGQVFAMRILLRDPKGKAPWYNAVGVTMFVSGMMVTAFALRSLGAA